MGGFEDIKINEWGRAVLLILIKTHPMIPNRRNPAMVRQLVNPYVCPMVVDKMSAKKLMPMVMLPA